MARLLREDLGDQILVMEGDRCRTGTCAKEEEEHYNERKEEGGERKGGRREEKEKGGEKYRKIYLENLYLKKTFISYSFRSKSYELLILWIVYLQVK